MRYLLNLDNDYFILSWGFNFVFNLLLDIENYSNVNNKKIRDNVFVFMKKL